MIGIESHGTGAARGADLPAAFLASLREAQSIDPAFRAQRGPRLEQRTELDRGVIEQALLDSRGFGECEEPVWRAVNVRDYGDGLVELGYSPVQFARDDRLKFQRQPDLPMPSPEVRAACNLSRSVRRSRAQVRRKCMAGNLDHLLTLTYRQSLTDTRRAYQDFSRFIRLVRKHRKAFPYVCVHEFQKRGAIHFHLAVRGFQDVRFLRSCWLAVVGEGNIDVQAPGFKGRSAWARAKLAGYLSKYITKESASLSGKQRYRVAEGIEVPSEVRVLKFPRFYDFVAEIFDSLGVPLAFHWKANDGPHGWACSW